YRSTHVSTYLHWRAESLLPLPQFQCKACAIPGESVRILGFSERILRNPQLTDPTKLLAARLMRQDEAIRLPPIWRVFAAGHHRHGKHNRPRPGCRTKPRWASRGTRPHGASTPLGRHSRRFCLENCADNRRFSPARAASDQRGDRENRSSHPLRFSPCLACHTLL